jgi:hypothetical protein
MERLFIGLDFLSFVSAQGDFQIDLQKRNVAEPYALLPPAPDFFSGRDGPYEIDPERDG